MRSDIDSFVFDRVAKAIRLIVCGREDDLTLFTRITDDLALGRYGRMKLAICLEETFDLELENSDVEGFAMIGDIVRHISRKYFRDIEIDSATQDKPRHFPAPL